MECQFCFGCMEQIRSYPCPHCGYRPDPESLPYALQPGTILKGRYLVGKVLGQGGFGITYVGMDLQLQRKIAIKEYYPANFAFRKDATGMVWWNSNDASQEVKLTGQEMFLKEARKMGKVSRIQEVVQVYDMFQENDTAYICMDFIEGITLVDHLKSRGPLSWAEAKEIFLPAMAAMERVHKAGLVHRDLSPDNIMLQAEGGIRILDLGAAKDLKVNSGKSSMQVAKNGFSPPEQYMNSGNSGSWTDVYSMAATMYYALTGVLPLTAMDRLDLEGDNLSWDHPRLLALPQTVQNAMKRAMTLRISQRTQTMAEFARELQAEPAPQPIPQPVFKPEPKPERKSEPKPEPKSQPKPVEKKPKKKLLWALAAMAAVLVVGVFILRPSSPEVVSAAPGYGHTVVLMPDGTVKAFGDNTNGQCDVSQWSDIVAVSTNNMTTIGLKTDGTVVATGQNDNGECNVSEWSDITAIASGRKHTAGLKEDGTVVAVGDNSAEQCKVSNWKTIVAIAAGKEHTVGLRADGTVVVAGNYYLPKCSVTAWRDIAAISAGAYHTVGLKTDGTVVATGTNAYGECFVSHWKDIASISAGYNYTLGVTSGGDVLVAGKYYGKSDVSQWKDIAAIWAGTNHTIGLTKDGKILTTGNNQWGQCDIDLS